MERSERCVQPRCAHHVVKPLLVDVPPETTLKEPHAQGNSAHLCIRHFVGVTGDTCSSKRASSSSVTPRNPRHTTYTSELPLFDVAGFDISVDSNSEHSRYRSPML